MASLAQLGMLNSLLPPPAGTSVSRCARLFFWSNVVFSLTFFEPCEMSRLNSTLQKSALADALYLSAIGKAGIPALNSTSKLQPLCERWAVMVASPRLRPLGQLML